jgi:hypothetical protein
MVDAIVLAVERYPIILAKPLGIVVAVDDGVGKPTMVGYQLLIGKFYHGFIAGKPIQKVKAIDNDKLAADGEAGMAGKHHTTRRLGPYHNGLRGSALAADYQLRIAPLAIFQHKLIARLGFCVSRSKLGRVFYKRSFGQATKTKQHAEQTKLYFHRNYDLKYTALHAIF